MTQPKARLLIITQDIEIKRLIENLMRHERIQAAITESVAEARLFLRTNALPDIVVLDISQPDLQWIEFLRQMRGQTEYLRIPVLVLTEMPDPDRVRMALQAGANRYLTKLFAAKNLLPTINEMQVPVPPKATRPLTARLGGKG